MFNKYWLLNELGWLHINIINIHTVICKSKVSKGIPVTGPGVPQGCDMLRFPHFLDNRLINGGKFVSPTRRLPFTLKNIPGTHFC
jgi:hypothetical protein